MHDIFITEGQAFTVGGVPVALVRARGKRARLLVATATGNELDGPLPVESREMLEIAANRILRDLEGKQGET